MGKRHTRRRWILAAAAIAILAGCAKKDSGDAAPQAGRPGAGAASVPTDGHAVPLKQTGLGSASELQRELRKLSNATAAATFETAFRQTFTTDKSQRDYATARIALADFIMANPTFAPAYRTLAYAEFNLNPADPAASLAEYDKAVALEPEYGEAHYAIAFMCAATGEREKGAAHFRKAMQLGVPDERNIGANFYADVIQTH